MPNLNTLRPKLSPITEALCLLVALVCDGGHIGRNTALVALSFAVAYISYAIFPVHTRLLGRVRARVRG